jgi:hypothetical protein
MISLTPGLRSSAPAESPSSTETLPYSSRAGICTAVPIGWPHLVLRFVLAACITPYFLSRHEFYPVVELAHQVLYAVREHGHLKFPALEVVYHMARESRVCRERIVNVCETKLVRNNQELVMA